MQNHIAIFKGTKIRKTIHDGEWWFSVIDVVEALIDSADAGAYWRKLKERLKEEGSEVVTFCHGLKLLAPDGKMRETDCADTEGMFRIIQSIPSPVIIWMILSLFLPCWASVRPQRSIAPKIHKGFPSLNPTPKPAVK